MRASNSLFHVLGGGCPLPFCRVILPQKHIPDQEHNLHRFHASPLAVSDSSGSAPASAKQHSAPTPWKGAPAAWQPRPPWASRRPRRSAAERRAQALRAEGRVCQRLLTSFSELQSHRGGWPTQLGLAFADALNGNRKTIVPAWASVVGTAVQTAQTVGKEVAVQTAQTHDHAVHATVQTSSDGHTAALEESSTQTEAYEEKPSQWTREEADSYIENVPQK